MKHPSERKVYFTVFTTYSGFTDQLVRFMAMRKLGLSLGYSYLHTPLLSRRTMNVVIEGPRWSLQYLYLRALRVYYRYLAGDSYRSPYHFMGLDEHFASQETECKPRTTELKMVKVNLSGAFLEKNNISTLEELQRWIKKAVLREESAGRSLLVCLKLLVPLTPVLDMLASIPAATDELDLRAIYFERRRKHPWKSRFPRGRMKMLVHIRLGDKAAFKTPWNTWLYFDHRPQPHIQILPTWETARGENEFRQLTVADFHKFTQDLVSRFTDGTFAVMFFSDGFGSTAASFRKLRKHLLRSKREFKVLRSIKNSVSIIGETPAKFLHFFHSALTANLVIAAFPLQHPTVWKLMALHSGSSGTPVMPVVILLHKPNAEKELQIFLGKSPERSEEIIPVDPGYLKKIIPVNIADPDFDRIVARLNELLPDLNGSILVPPNAPASKPEQRPADSIQDKAEC